MALGSDGQVKRSRLEGYGDKALQALKDVKKVFKKHIVNPVLDCFQERKQANAKVNIRGNVSEDLGVR